MPNVDQIVLIAPYIIIAEIALRASKPILKTVLFRLITRKIPKTSSNERLLVILSAALIADYDDVTIETEDDKISLKKESSGLSRFNALKKSLKRINPDISGERE